MKACFPVFALLGSFFVAADCSLASLPMSEGETRIPGQAPYANRAWNGAPQGVAKSDWPDTQAAHEAWQHRVSPREGQSGEWQAHNPGQQWTTIFDGQGFTTMPQGALWQWGLALRSYGFGESGQHVA